MVQKLSSKEVYNALTLPILLHGSKIWTLRKKDNNRLTSTEMKFFRTAARNTLHEYKSNEEILEELEVESVDEKLRRQIKLAMTYNKNEQQQDAKNRAEL